MRPPKLFSWDQGPDGDCINRSFWILIGLWPETDGNVHHWICISVTFFFFLFAFVYSGSCVWARCAKIATTDKGNMTYQPRCVTAWFKTWNILTLDWSAMAGLYLKLIGFVRQPPFCTHFCMAKVHSSTTVRYFYVRIERYTNVNFKKWDKTLNSVQIFGTNALSKQRTNC